MRIGSLVQQCKEFTINPEFSVLWMHGKNDILTIRNIKKCTVTQCTVLYFEEGIMGYNDRGNEMGNSIEYYKELMPPINNIEQFISENTLEKVES